MNIQQLRYIVAIDRFRNFARAADACNISQPTLSAMLVKLEDELDVRIFDRTNKVVKPTSVGERIIRQAQKALMETNRINELITESKGTVGGQLTLSIGPTIAPYLLPRFIKHYRQSYPSVELTVKEMKALMETNRINELITESKGTVGGQLTLSIGPTIAPYLLPRFIKHYRQSYPSVELTVKEMKADHMLEAILNGEIDAGIAISGNARQGVLEMPLYTERFYVYLAESCWRKLPVFKPENLEHENMWIMKEAQCLRDSAFSFCKARGKGHHVYEAGSIETLIRIVDENGGYTIIPEMHLPFLTEKQAGNVREIQGDYLSQRRISLYIKDDYIRQRMLNTVADTLKRFVPARMMGEGIVKYGIKL